MNVLRWDRQTIAAAVPVAAVAVVAGIQSYSHIEALGLSTGQSLADARLLPLAVDGLIIAGSAILMAGSLLGWLGVAPGIGATVFANVASGLAHGPLGATVAAWPAAAFSLASFTLERWLKSRAQPPQASASQGRGQCPHTAASSANEAVVQAFLHGRDCLDDQPSQRQLSAAFGMPRTRVAELVGSLNGHHPPETGGHQTTA